MRVFWKKGFTATSIDDLVDATGVSRYGLYGEFGDKTGLFLAALAHYQGQVVGPILDIVNDPNSGLGEIRHIFTMLANFACQPGGSAGCLLFNAVAEIGLFDPAIANRILDISGQLHRGLTRMLANAVARGQLPADFAIEREADFLFGVMHALPLMARAGTDDRVLRNLVEVALSTLPDAA